MNHFFSFCRLCFIILIFQAGSVSPLFAHHQGTDVKKRLLILNSFNPGYTWTDNMLRGIDDALNKSGLKLETSLQFMDMKRIKPSDAYYLGMKELLKEGYRNTRFDALIACDNDALEFMRMYRDELFPGVPLVFSSINDYDEKMLDGRKDLTGTSENTDYLGTINIALKLRPATKTVVVVSDGTTTGLEHVDAVRKIQAKVPGEINFTYLSLAEYTLDELATKLSTLPNDTIILLLHHFKDKNGDNFTVQESTSVLASRSSVPLFVLSDIRIGLGPLGGSVVSGYHHGEAAANMAIEVLKGRSIATMPVMLESPNRFMFDYNAMKRFGISEKLLPKGSIVVNRPISNFEKYRTLFYISSLVVILLVTLIVILVVEILRRRKAEQQLRSSSEQIKSFFNCAVDCIFIHDSHGKFLDCNQKACDSLGYTREEILRMTVRDIDVGANDVGIWDLIDDNRSSTVTGQHTRKDGSSFPVEVRLGAIGSGDHKTIIAIARDITERAEADKFIRESEERYRILFDKSPLGILLVESETLTILHFNSAACRSLGYEPEEFSRLRIMDFEVNDNREAISSRVEQLQKEGEVTFETVHLTKQRELRNVLVHLKIITLAGRRIIQSIHQDITEMKQAQKELDSRKRLLDTLLANLPVGVFMVEAPTGKALIANAKAQELLGRGILPDANNENLSELYEAYRYGTMERYPVEEMPIVRGMYGESVTVDDLLVVRPDGVSKLLEIAGAPVLDAEGNPIASLVCFQDITDRKEQEKEQLRVEKLESLGVLAGGIAHDFNNILTSIMGNISLAQMFVNASSKSHKPLQEAEKGSMRAAELAHQLLTFARGGEPIKAVVSVGRLVKETASLVLSGSNVKGEVHIQDSVHSIEADEGQISQVCSNLIINAAQAMPGGGRLTISAENETLDDVNLCDLPAGPYVKLSFADEGCGISEEDQKKIFDPYFTTKLNGNGLGLASAISIVTRHGGHIGVKSTLGKGATFVIHLPSTGTAYGAANEPQATSSIGLHAGGNILVMDDEEMIRELASGILDHLGYSVTTCADGASAVAEYQDAKEAGTPFSAVILDLTIPGGMGGMEAAEKIRESDPAARLIVSSGYSSDAIMSDFRKHGFSGAVSKPYKVADLGNLLSSLLPTHGTSSVGLSQNDGPGDYHKIEKT